MEQNRLAISPAGRLVQLRTKPLIAILDDEVHVCELLSLQLAEIGYDTVSYGYKDECFAELAKTLPDAIISDIISPRMDGIQFLRAIRFHPQFQFIPVIIASGNIPRLESMARELGALACYSKPFDVNLIIKTIRDALGQ